MKAQFWIYAAAGFNVALALFHVSFWRVFRWREELPKLHPANRGVMQVLNIMLTLVFLFMAALQAIWAHELPATKLGQMLLVGMTGFWAVRTFLQFLYWRELPAKVNWAFGALFVVGTGLHALTLQAR